MCALIICLDESMKKKIQNKLADKGETNREKGVNRIKFSLSPIN